ncbi:hypothetical protein IE53DRAFT_408510 [Violaceomyces palustris]|uniref:Uncharacterized protein n=1 Tax=Violaceomyces palustris TaxID=1673888 RepID=A0ACD0P6C3_9BASI|nr:hypothetical protein IE53DRAFT_408510 [Violaceomyces palustris]
MSGSSLSYRNLGLHERFCVSRHKLGEPPIVSLVAKIEGRLCQEIEDSFKRRVSELLLILPVLSCRISESDSSKPKFRRVQDELGPDDIYRSVDHPIFKSEVQPSFSCASSRILSEEIHSLGRVDIELGPLWRLTTYPSHAEKSFYVALTVHHVISDGQGSSNLLKTFLQDDLPTRELLTGGTEDCMPPISDQTEDMRPRLTFLLPIIFREIVLPKLPSFLSCWFDSGKTWPYFDVEDSIARCSNPSTRKKFRGNLNKKPIECLEKGRKVVHLSGKGLLADLKRESKRIGVTTLHPVLHSCIMVSLISSLSQEIENVPISGGEGVPDVAEANTVEGTESEAKRNRVRPLNLRSETPISIRKPLESKHGLCHGNFVADLEYSKSFELPTRGGECLSDQLETFHRLTLDYDHRLNSESGRRESLYNMGMLGYIPNGEKGPSSAEVEDRSWTGWERYFYEKSKGERPFRSSFGISNLGRFDPLPSERQKTDVDSGDGGGGNSKGSISLSGLKPEALAWSQPPSLTGSALVIDAIGLQGKDDREDCLTLVVCWRKGCLEDGLVETFVEKLGNLVHLVAGKMGPGIESQDTISQISQRI